MKKIAELQNNPDNMKLLGTQRELYSSAKKVFGFQFLFNVFVSVALAILAMFYEEITVYAALYGILFTIIDIIGFVPLINKMKRKAATLQERYECAVLEIELSDLKNYEQVSEEEISNNYHLHIRNQKNLEGLKNWYSEKIDCIRDTGVATLICQRSNNWWDLKLKRRYITGLLSLLIFVTVAIIVIGLIKEIKLKEMILILNALMPFFLFIYHELSDHYSAKKTLEHLHTFFDTKFKELENKTLDKSTLPDLSRRVQDELFEHRANGPLVPDWFYYRYRSLDQAEMERIIGELIEKVKDA